MQADGGEEALRRVLRHRRQIQKAKPRADHCLHRPEPLPLRRLQIEKGTDGDTGGLVDPIFRAFKEYAEQWKILYYLCTFLISGLSFQWRSLFSFIDYDQRGCEGEDALLSRKLQRPGHHLEEQSGSLGRTRQSSKNEILRLF